jgi:hypothetical protein
MNDHESSEPGTVNGNVGPTGRRRRDLAAAISTPVLLMGGGGAWWRHEVTAEPGLEFRTADCDPAGLQSGGSSGLVDLRLRYRILGITRTADVPFRDTVLGLQASGGCAAAMTDQRRHWRPACQAPLVSTAEVVRKQTAA